MTQIAQRLTDEQLGEFFTQAGRVKGAKIVIDKVTRRSKGVAYVEFYEQESVAKALELAGQKLLGIPVIVQPSEAEKNRLAAEQAAAARAHASGRESATALPLGTPKAEMFNRVFIGGIHYNLSEDDIQLVFKPFGNLTEVRLEQDETGRSKGYGFLRYERSEDARTAVERMNGFQLAGRFIKVSLVTEQSSLQEGRANLKTSTSTSVTPVDPSPTDGGGAQDAPGSALDDHGK